MADLTRPIDAVAARFGIDILVNNAGGFRHLAQNGAVNGAAHGRVTLGLPVDNPAF